MQQGQAPQPKFRVEKRVGKAVTVIAGLHTYGEKRLNDIASELKRMFGTGGTVKNGQIEIQGERLEEIKAWFKETKGKV